MISVIGKKYIEACFNGNIDIVECMIKKEGKTLKSDELLLKCLHRACDGDNIDVCKMIFAYKNIARGDTNNVAIDLLGHACKIGRLSFVLFYLDILSYSIESAWLLYKSCESGNMDLIQFMLDKTSHLEYDTNMCVYHSCLSGNMETFEYFFDKYGHKIGDFAPCLRTACEGGNVEIVEHVMKHGDDNLNYDDFNSCFYSAGLSGNIEIIHVLERGLTQTQRPDKMPQIKYDRCMQSACYKGHIDIIKFILQKRGHHVTKFDGFMELACSHGHMEIIKIMAEKGAANYYNLNRCAEMVCIFNRYSFKILDYLIEKGANRFNTYLEYACKYGRIDYVNYLIQKGATNWNRGLMGACRGGSVKLVQLMIKYGATDFNNGLYLCTTCCKNADVCNILISHGATNIYLLSAINDFKLYCRWSESVDYTDKYLRLLMEYPPYVLFVGSRLSKKCNECVVKRLPVELFTLLVRY